MTDFKDVIFHVTCQLTLNLLQFMHNILDVMKHFLRATLYFRHRTIFAFAKTGLAHEQAGFGVEPEPEVEARFKELKYLEKSIGRTGRLAVSPMLNMSDHDLWQLYMLGKR